MQYTTNPRRGVALVYLTVSMVALLAFCSLAVDLGRVQLVKTELRCAVDAATRAGVAGLSSSVTQAQNNVVSYAAFNLADGSPVVIDPASDIEFGTWDTSARTFTVLSGAQRSNANAMRITARRLATRGNAVPLFFAGILGRTTCDVRASAIACLPVSSSGTGLAGLTSVTMSGNGWTDSYDSSMGPYNAGTAGSNGSVASNGNISLSGNARVNGDAHPGPGKTVNRGGNASVSGSTSPATSLLSYATPSLPSSYISKGNFSLSGNSIHNLAAGTYYYTSFKVTGNGTLNVNGPVTIYVKGTVNLAGNANIYQNRPGNFKIRMISGSVSISGNGALYADIYAPVSAVSITGNGTFYGALIGKTLNLAGNGGIHYDESLGYGVSTPSTIRLVQ